MCSINRPTLQRLGNVSAVEVVNALCRTIGKRNLYTSSLSIYMHINRFYFSTDFVGGGEWGFARNFSWTTISIF